MAAGFLPRLLSVVSGIPVVRLLPRLVAPACSTICATPLWSAVRSVHRGTAPVTWYQLRTPSLLSQLPGMSAPSALLQPVCEEMSAVDHSRRCVTLKEYGVLNAYSSDYPGTYDTDDAWSMEKFRKKFRVRVVHYTNLELEFDLIGIHTSIVNAFRRILLSEVPSMAIEKVLVYNNTTLLQDEVLAHRLGLVPLRADPRLFEYRQEGDDEGTEQDTLQFELKLKCSWDRSSVGAPEGRRRLNSNVYTKHIKWLPVGTQRELYMQDSMGPIEPDILIAKMVPGQELDLRLHAIKGVGRDHAKFSPVATAFYRLLPQITLLREVEGEQAERLQKCFSPGVIALEDTKAGRQRAVVRDARYDTCSRNVYRYDDLKDAVRMDRVRDHFIFTIESVGALPPDVLFVEAIKVLKNRCRTFLTALHDI